jgi:acetylornithine aminotransferase
MTSAKALGGGLPVGAVVTTPELSDVLTRGDHGSTFAGAPITAAAALAARNLNDHEQRHASVRELGDRLRGGLERVDGVEEVRGRGLMVGLTLAEGLDAAAIGARALDDGLVINVPGERMLRLLPPLVIDEGDVDRAVEILVGTFS